jgi:D-serine deaminase-like pyridoxal phosphate-dependent protein
LKKWEIPTPALVVDIDKLTMNIDEMATRVHSAGLALRPHIKTHKTPIISQMQINAGAVGIACAKLGEAEVMAAAGIEDIFIAYPIVGQDKVDRLVNLAFWVPKISTSVDTIAAATAINDTALVRGVRIDVMVEVEAGYRRTGVAPDEQLLRLVKAIVTSMPGLRYKGLMYMAGGTGIYIEPEKQLAGELAGAKIATDAAVFLAANGINTEVISGGSTPGAKFVDKLQGVTEYRPGCYVFGDMKYADIGALKREQMSLTILVTVVSVPDVSEPDHFVVDAGSKTLTHCLAMTTPGYGTFVQYPQFNVTVASEEHGSVYLPKGAKPPRLGT